MIENIGLNTNRLSREYINSCELLRFNRKITIIKDNENLLKTTRFLKNYDKLGFDTETKPAFKKGTVNPLSLIQLATFDEAFIIQVKFISNLTPLADIFENEEIKKIGVGIKDDLKKLKEIIDFEPNGFVDLAKIAEQKGIIQTGLRALSVRYLQKRISKTVQKSNWHTNELTNKQIIYAATDAWAALKLYEPLINDNTDYRKFLEEEPEENQQLQLQLPPE